VEDELFHAVGHMDIQTDMTKLIASDLNFKNGRKYNIFAIETILSVTVLFEVLTFVLVFLIPYCTHSPRC
jgi:hypothetical protein